MTREPLVVCFEAWPPYMRFRALPSDKGAGATVIRVPPPGLWLPSARHVFRRRRWRQLARGAWDVGKCRYCGKRLRSLPDRGAGVHEGCLDRVDEIADAPAPRFRFPNIEVKVSPTIDRHIETLVGIQSSAEVRTYWESLPEIERARLAVSRPFKIGAIAGVPFTVRDWANRIGVQALLDEAHGAATSRDDATWHSLLRYAMAKVPGPLLKTLPGGPEAFPHQILLVDPKRHLLALGHGEVDRAHTIAVHVPGMGSDMASFAAIDRQWLNVAALLPWAAPQFVAKSLSMSVRTIEALLFGGTAPAPTVGQGSDRPENYYLVTWLGYEAPGPRLLFDRDITPALRAGADLAGFIDAARLEGNTYEPTRIVLSGFSYGSTVAGAAARCLFETKRAQVDRLILSGSPGVPFDAAVQIGLTPRKIICFRGSDDIVSSASMGTDPAHPSLATVMPGRPIAGITGRVTGHSNPAHDLRRANRAASWSADEIFRDSDYFFQAVARTSRRSTLWRYVWCVVRAEPGCDEDDLLGTVKDSPQMGTVLAAISPLAATRRVVRLVLRRLNRPIHRRNRNATEQWATSLRSSSAPGVSP